MWFLMVYDKVDTLAASRQLTANHSSSSSSSSKRACNKNKAPLIDRSKLEGG